MAGMNRREAMQVAASALLGAALPGVATMAGSRPGLVKCGTIGPRTIVAPNDPNVRLYVFTREGMVTLMPGETHTFTI